MDTNSIMKKLNATQGRAEDGWLDGLGNIPLSWGLAKQRILYGYDFDQTHKYDLPSDQCIGQLARDTKDDDYVLIDIEGWNLKLPCSGVWNDWDSAPADQRARADSAAEWNQLMIDQRIHVLKEFKKFNQHSKLSWWATPGTGNGWGVWDRDSRGYRWPECPTNAYHGTDGTWTWALQQLRGLLDFGGVVGYWDMSNTAYDLEVWKRSLQHCKHSCDVGLDAPMQVIIANRKLVSGVRQPPYDWFEPQLLDQMLHHLDVILEADDTVSWWEGNSIHMTEMDRQLDEYSGNEYWITAFNRWMPA